MPRPEPASRSALRGLALALPVWAPLAALAARVLLVPGRSEGWDLGLLLFALAFALALAALRGAPARRAQVALAGAGVLIALALGFGVRAGVRAMVGRPPDWRAEAAALRDADWNEAYWREFHESYRAQWHPYVYWRRQPYDGEWIGVDALGRRRTVNVVTEAEADHVVWMFGGSALWGTGAPDGMTIPSYLARELADRGRRVHVVNWGESGWVSTQELIQLELLLRAGDPPDLVVLYDGVNDFYAAAQSRVPGIPQNEGNRRAEFGGNPGLRAAPGAAGERVGDDDELARRTLALYRGNLAIVRALAADRGFSTLFAWQPVALLDKPLAPDEAEALGRVDPAARRLFEAHYAAVRAGPAPPGFVDLSGLFADRPEPLYIDFCHLAPAGNRIVAERLAERIVPMLAD